MMIKVRNLTKDFGGHKGIFDLSFEVQEGEVFGYLGPKGAGKTTTLRQLMGFSGPGGGRCSLNGKNCYRKADEIQRFTGYLPEHVSLPEMLTGIEFIRFMAQMRRMKSIERAMKLAEQFELDLEERIREMSAETRQKVGIICAFMHDPEILLLDEPTNGLNSLMQKRFAELILTEKERGKTILIAAHMFDEVGRSCDRVGMIRGGILVNVDDIANIRAAEKRSYLVTFASEQEALQFAREAFLITDIKGMQVTVDLSGEMAPLLKVLGNYQVIDFEAKVQSLREVFSHFYGGDLHV